MDIFILAWHSYEERHHVSLRDARILQIEPSNTCRQHKESAHMTCVLGPVSQPTLDVLLFGYCIISRKSASYNIAQLSIVWLSCTISWGAFSCTFLSHGLYLMLVSCQRPCRVLWNSCCDCSNVTWFSFQPHILNYFASILHCNNGEVGSVHWQSSFFKSYRIISFRRL